MPVDVWWARLGVNSLVVFFRWAKMFLLCLSPRPLSPHIFTNCCFWFAVKLNKVDEDRQFGKESMLEVLLSEHLSLYSYLFLPENSRCLQKINIVSHLEQSRIPQQSPLLMPGPSSAECFAQSTMPLTSRASKSSGWFSLDCLDFALFGSKTCYSPMYHGKCEWLYL